MNRALSSVGRGCLSATFSRPIPIYFSDELLFQGLVALGVFFCIWLWGRVFFGAFFFFPPFKNLF